MLDISVQCSTMITLYYLQKSPKRIDYKMISKPTRVDVSTRCPVVPNSLLDIIHKNVLLHWKTICWWSFFSLKDF